MRPAGTHLRDVIGRLMVDLSWASSKLEGNTYSRLDTENLIRFGTAAEGKDLIEAQKILNHNAAIELIAEAASPPPSDLAAVNAAGLQPSGFFGADGLAGPPRSRHRYAAPIAQPAPDRCGWRDRCFRQVRSGYRASLASLGVPLRKATRHDHPARRPSDVTFFFIASKGPGKAGCFGIRTAPHRRCSGPSGHAGNGVFSDVPLHGSRRLGSEPTSATIPATSAEQDNNENYDEDCGQVHEFLSCRCLGGKRSSS